MEIVALASAVPLQETAVVVKFAPLSGEVMTGAFGAIVSGAVTTVTGVDWLVVFSIGGGGFVTPPPPPPRMPIVGMMVNEGVALPCPFVVAPALP